MARMYSRKVGKSGSTKPSTRAVPVWSRYKQKEIELLISKISKEEKSTSKIGMILRDIYGIPDVKTLCNKSISKILTEKKLQPQIPEDLLSLIKRSIKIRKHLEENKNDQTAKRGLNLTEAKLRKIAAYFKKKGKLDKKWTYTPK